MILDPVTTDSNTGAWLFTGAASLQAAVAEVYRNPVQTTDSSYIFTNGSTAGVAVLHFPLPSGSVDSITLNLRKAIGFQPGDTAEVLVNSASIGTFDLHTPSTGSSWFAATFPVSTVVTALQVRLTTTSSTGGGNIYALYLETVDSGTPDIPTDDYGQAIYNDGPIIYYRGDEHDGASVIVDYSGHANHGIAHNDLQFQQSAIISTGSAIYFPGGAPLASGAYIEMPAAPLRTLTAATVEMWLVWDDDQPDERLFDFSNGITGQNIGRYVFCSVAHHTSGLCRAAVTNAGINSDVVVDSVPIIRGRRYHVVVTLGNGTLAIWINKVKYSEAATTETFASVDIQEAWISRSPWGVDPYFKGKKDEIAVYPRILTPEEIANHYDIGIAPGDSGSSIKEISVDDIITFNQTTSYFLNPAGAGRVFNMSLRDTLNISDGASGPPQRQAVKDTLFFNESSNEITFPTRRKLTDQLVFSETAHGSPYRIKITDTLSIIERLRHNQFKIPMRDDLLLVENPDPHWFQPRIDDDLVFFETVWDQNNHQYLTDVLVIDDDVEVDRSITNFAIQDSLELLETANLRWHIANIKIIDTLNLVEETHRVWYETVTDILVIESLPIHVIPIEIDDLLTLVETVDVKSSKVIQDVLTLIERICVQSGLHGAITDTLALRQYVTVLLNGQEDSRNGGNNGGLPGGIGFKVIYRKMVLDRLVIIERITSVPAPVQGQECTIVVN